MHSNHLLFALVVTVTAVADATLEDGELPPIPRAASGGHAPISANLPAEEQAASAVPPPYQQLQGFHTTATTASFQPASSFSSSQSQTWSQQQSQQQQSASASAAADQPPPIDPLTGLAFLEYVRFLLENYPDPSQCGGKCDLSKYTKCTCADPPVYTPEGSGNCNFGATKTDKRVWCYVNEKFGHPLSVCPDTRKSLVRPGLFYSSLACITP